MNQPKPFPGPPLLQETPQRDTVQAAVGLSELFPVLKFVKLESGPDSNITDIEDVTFLHGFWFVLDARAGMVLRFTEDGSFAGPVGNKGNGPGEYQMPSRLKKCFDNQIGVLDANDGTLLLYDVNGAIVREISLREDPFNTIPGQDFIWKDADELFLADVSSLDPTTPRHLLIRIKDNIPSKVEGFGARPSALKRGMPTLPFTAFQILGDHIWAAPPHSADMEVYRRDGSLAGKIQRKDPNKLTPVQFAETGVSRELFQFTRNWRIFPVGDLMVAVTFESGRPMIDLFDANGNLVKDGLLPSVPYGMPHGSFEDVLIGALDFSVTGSRKMLETLPKDTFQQLLAAGLDPDQIANDNPYLVVGRFLGQ